MKLEELGYNERLKKLRNEVDFAGFEIGRVVAEHKERYIVMTESGEPEAEITGNLRFTARSREDFPAVGDWVSLTLYEAGFAIIHKVFPRSSVISRKAVGLPGEMQVIAANVDRALLIQAVDRDFNINRLERYLTICYSSGVSPAIVLTKTDLADEHRLSGLVDAIYRRIPDVPVIGVSNETRFGYEELGKLMQRGMTCCMLGSSGAGKSTLLNNLAGRTVMQTDHISASTGKGRHVTSHRELILLGTGAILIDNPGMREVGIGDSSGGLETTFDLIFSLSRNCKFKDCTHTTETGCSVIEAVGKGVIDSNYYENYLRMEREKAHYDLSVAERRKRDKHFGKILKIYKRDINKNMD